MARTDPARNGGRAADPAARRAAAVDELRESLRDLLHAATGLVLDRIEDLARTLERTAAAGGLPVAGLIGGVRAGLQGRNPVWGAFTGAVGALSPAARVALVAALVLALLLLPVTVVLLLLALIVLVIVAAARAGS